MIDHLITIGAASGGVAALKKLVADLPADLNAPVLIVLHAHSSGGPQMDRILGAVGKLPVKYAVDGVLMVPGTIYVAPVDRHLLVEDEILRLVRGPKENGHRPAIDPLFRTAAISFGSRAIAVILTGSLNDGTAGMIGVKDCGGTAVVQDPKDAEVPQMPLCAMTHLKVDHCLPIGEIGPLLARLATEPPVIDPGAAPSDALKLEASIAAMQNQDGSVADEIGKRSTLSCPECHGPLWQIDDGRILRYRCFLGHGFTAEALDAEQTAALEKALWVALQSIEASAALALQLASRATEEGDEFAKDLLEARARKASELGAQVRTILINDRAS
jgi:two-component system chemotaxis response regulator CheB